jgi:ABC-type uncharacterized transport system ATPase subunit
VSVASPESSLELSNLSRRFGPLVALDDVSLTVRPGTVHALLGENGAGKTTLMRIAFGMVRPDHGSIRVAGHAADIHTPADAIAAGIGMVHQHFTLVPAMSVAENLVLGGHGRLSARDAAATVREISALTGFALDPAARVDTLPVGAQQRVEIAKALVRRARVLVLDEPTAVLAPPEVDDLLRWLRGFVAAGNSAVLVTHKLREALAVADDITVLRRGRLHYHGSARDATEQSLTEAMIGRTLSSEPSDRRGTGTSVDHAIVFRARDMSVRDTGESGHVVDATFEIRGGEIVGVAAVEGSGQRALLRALAGRADVASGTLRRPDSVGFIPEDRHEDAVMLERSLTENLALRGAGARRGLVDWTAVRERTQALLGAYDVRAASPEVRMRQLSGGNQQKVVLARELSELSPADAVVAENPTRGLDVRATADIHARLRAARDNGTAVILYSSDLDEVLALADRMLVIHAGTVRELALDRETIGRAMLGLA